METSQRDELASFLTVLPPVDFCCVYGSTLHPNNQDKVNHYASWMVHLGGARLITQVADKVGVGVHFNPFVSWNDRLKYGVVRMNDLVQDILDWNRFYLSGRLQKPVHLLVDNLDIQDVNSVNKRAAVSAALLLLPSKFTEEDLYAKICSLSYMGDLRMLFAEDTNKVNKIVKGQFDLFQSMYKPFLEECETKNLLRFSSAETNLVQDSSLSSSRSLVSSLPASVRSQMRKLLGEKKTLSETGRVSREVCIGSREEAAKCMEKVMKRRVMVSSARQAVSGFLAAGAINATVYLSQKMRKAWNSRS
ncbi:PREDICTED: phosphatidate cytidylyltransferase, mitochondrial-like isoform X5 [Brassica oleracea var. oleracea]|uniref:phosphatidate cytidylyltransferase, mitochondrial-like isoform X5 n=1 Tax=Brassica oleracea var. oleracea TaxID=109376 RepID=UPI0006A6A9C6|nr:PREDICTED: phosphatidate cytidylyltransferase, mitochondrial-like isoform X5 [Brassica oleracea var. oleracea]XP_013602516.1 PREDICTED: phosphatidate cytidylyltransferase, mitochondrial-like isoform X5 [Brassica oleracea var. oleracea]XP_013602616.1 PREDICTED: phosphatidate cytidylyltransferase, mitochondrial-like isoform X5 [Brassica oleracea var. oleracea]